MVLTTAAAFWQFHKYNYINYDDGVYVYENAYVKNGLTGAGLAWAFKTFHGGNWHPLTWLSHMLDCELFGLRPGMHHLINLLFHLANTLLLFLVFKKMTGTMWRSAFAAAMFAVHPLHVESVAWIAERKDVLSTLFWISTIWAYARYAECPGFIRYLLIMIFFILGLMAKPMLVTLPFVLLLLDYWPLGRLQLGRTASEPEICRRTDSALSLIIEKLPLLGLAAFSCVMTFISEQSGGSVSALDQLNTGVRMANALVSYVAYIRKTIWPFDLAVFYPLSGTVAIWKVVGAALLLMFLSGIFLWAFRKRPYFGVGWLWYLGTLVPVIGLVQVGTQAMADRYTYVPLIGLFIIIAWGVSDLLEKRPYGKVVLSIIAFLTISMMMGTTWFQVRHWRNSVTLFTRAIDVTSNNYIAHNNLGLALLEQGRGNEAIEHFHKALWIKPDHVSAHNNLGNALKEEGRFEEAIKQYVKALQIRPDDSAVHNNLGHALAKRGDVEASIAHYLRALQINPSFAEAQFNLGNVLQKQGDLDAAIERYYEAIKLNPDFVEAHNNLGKALAKRGNLKGAVSHFLEALRVNPNYALAHKNLGIVLAMQGDFDGAARHFSEALRMAPGDEHARRNLTHVLRLMRKPPSAFDKGKK